MSRLSVLGLFLFAWLASVAPALADDWTKEQKALMRSLWIGSLPPLPADPGNAYADDPRAADLGHRLFFDTRLSANGKVACATCHEPDRAFTDGRRTSVGVGKMTRNAPTVVGIAYSRWLFWDGRKDSLWSQALAPFESPVEHGINRARAIDLVRRDPDYRRRYIDLFGALPVRGDRHGVARAFANLGKAIAAYERRLLPGPAKFDRYVAAILRGEAPAAADRLTLDEEMGLRIFIEDTQGKCLRCHSGPLFTDHAFHNIGLEAPGAKEPERGRLDGIETALADEFNCTGGHATAAVGDCKHLKGAKRKNKELAGAFKSPTLRNLLKTAPYMRTGHIDTLNDVMWHYRDRPLARIGETEIETMTMSEAEFAQIIAFLGTLDGPIDAPAKYLRAPKFD